MSTEENRYTPGRKAMERWYRETTRHYEEVLARFQDWLHGILQGAPGHPTVKARLKTFDSFYRKHLKRLQKPGADPKDIDGHDLLGVRVVCPFMEDLKAVEGILGEHLEILERESKGEEQSFREFGYKSTHLLVRIPPAIAAAFPLQLPPVCEVQLRTLLQDAWAEVEHELVYKVEFTPFDEALRRKLAALNANLTLSDIIFQEIRDYQNQLLFQLERRRRLFLDKLREESTDEAAEESAAGADHEPERSGGSPARRAVNIRPLMDNGTQNDIDQLLLEALYAHNAREFRRAIEIYTKILQFTPPRGVQSLIHVHRGMAYFSQAQFTEAARDFNRALEDDPANHRAWYLRGTVHTVLKDDWSALADYTESLRLNPFQHDPLFSRAQTCFRLGNHAEALTTCRKLLSLFPDSAETRRLMKQVQARLKR